MEDSKRRAYIKQQAAKKKQEKGQLFKGTGPAILPPKRKPSKKTDHPPKKPKVMPDSIVGLKAEPKKMATPLSQGRGKGLTTGHVLVTKKQPLLLREDSQYAL